MRTKGSLSATDGLSVLWRIAASGTGITLANGNVAIPVVNDKSGRKNLLVNGGLDIWQRGTSFLAVGGYTADRWVLSSSTRDVIQSTDVPTGLAIQPVYSLQCTGIGLVNPSIFTSIELPADGEPGPFAQNNKLVLSMWYKGPLGAAFGLRITFRDVVTSGTNQVDVFPFQTIATGTGAWQKIELLVDIGAASPAGTSKALVFNFDQSVNSSTFNIAQMQFEQSPVATDFEYRPIAEELALCQRYYEKSYNLEVTPGTATALGARSVIARTVSQAGGLVFKTRKRAPATLVVYSRDGNIGELDLLNGNPGTAGVAAASVNETSVYSFTGTAYIANEIYAAHYTADAEL